MRALLKSVRSLPLLVIRSGLTCAPTCLTLLLAISGCVGLEFPPEPSTDEEGVALNEAIQTLADAAECSDDGAYWPSTSGAPGGIGPLYVGLADGTVGSLSGLLTGTVHLITYPLGEGDSAAPPQEVDERYRPLILESARFLATQAISTSTGGLYWPQCLQTSEPELPASCSDSGVEAGLARICPEELNLPATGLAQGAAGVGAVFLALSEQTEALDWDALTGSEETPAPTAQLGPSEAVALDSSCDLLGIAQAAGHFLLETRCKDGSFPAVGTSCGSESVRYTGLEHGAAGIGWFFLRLWLSTGNEEWLQAASNVGDWLVSLLIVDGAEDVPASGAVPYSVGGVGGIRAGFWNGNAGVAWFLLEAAFQLQQAGLVGQSSRLLAGSLSVLEYLKNAELAQSDLGGRIWLSGDSTQDASVYTGLADGIAGISWVFLQAASSDLEGTSGLGDVAEAGARTLSHALVAHYYRGRIWWPTRLDSELDLEAPEDSGWASSDPLTSWLPDALGSTALRGWIFHPGLAIGTSGIGHFFRELSSSALSDTDSAQCFEALSDEAAHFLYLLGRPKTAYESWTWPEQGIRLVSGQSYLSPGSSGLNTGISGIIQFLARDRQADLRPNESVPASAMGLESMLKRSPGIDRCEARVPLSMHRSGLEK